MSRRVEALPVVAVPIKAGYPSILTDVRAITESHKPYEAWNELANTFNKRTLEVDINEKIDINQEPVPLYNVACYLACKFWIENVKIQRSPCIYELAVGDKTIKMVSMRGSSKDEGDVPGYTVDQMIHAGILGLNQMVVNTFKNDRRLLMTPLARVCATDSNIEEIGNLAKEYRDLRGNSSSLGTKLLNVNSSRKSWQFMGSTEYYWPELSIACLIRTILGPRTETQTDLIGKKQVKKVTNQGVVDPKQISDLVQCLNIPGSMNNEVEEIISLWKMGKNKTSFGRLESRGATTRMMRTARTDDTEDLIDEEDVKYHTTSEENVFEDEKLAGSAPASGNSSVAEFTDVFENTPKKRGSKK